MIDVVSVVIGAVVGAVFTASAYEILLRKKMSKIISLMQRANQVSLDIENLAEKIEEIKNKKGGDKK
jgi:hypothetical protein